METDESQDDWTRSFVALTAGTKVSHYRIVEKIGSGGMGEVYLAEDTQLDRKVALKFLALHLCQDEDCRRRFTREAQAAAKLSHPNIVTIHDVGELQGRPFFVMEYVEGRSLKEHIRQGDIINERIIAGAIQICEGLQVAHSAGIVHRDIKPSNIILDVNRRPRILDFGLAAVTGTEQLTKTGSTVGTVGYMSPEQISGQEVDRRSDLFSVGVVLYELFTGRLPFRGETEAATHQAILQDTPEPLARYNSSISDDLQRVISKLLEKDPELRYQSAAGLASDLKKIVRSRGETGTGYHAVGADAQPSIAVLPFTNLSTDPEQEYFCDGMAEEIINSLSQIKNLRVIARTSAFFFKGKNEDAREIGRKLGVNTLLEGSVRKAGSRLRITAQLIRASDGSQLWSERYDCEMKDVFAIQDEIAASLVGRLKVQLVDSEQSLPQKGYKADIEAYNLYQKGRYFLEMQTPEGYDKGFQCLKEAVEKDSQYALAHAWIGRLGYLASFFGSEPPDRILPVAKRHVQTALDIDPQSGIAHAVMASLHTYVDWDWVQAEREIQRALQLDPNAAVVHTTRSAFLTATGRHDQAVAAARRGRELDPLSNMSNFLVGHSLYFAQRYDEAIDDIRYSLSINPHHHLFHSTLGYVYRMKGLTAEALDSFQTAMRLSDGVSWEVMMNAIMLFESGIKDRAHSLLQHLKEKAKSQYVPPICFYLVHRAFGQPKKAAPWLQKAYEGHDTFLAWCRVSPDESLRILPGKVFDDMLKQMGLK